jgi:hypothetical protein
VLVSSVALWAAWHRRAKAWTGSALWALLGLASLGSLILYVPKGDTAEASHALAAMERDGEAAALTAPLLTEGFQNAYDGSLPVWGVPSLEDAQGAEQGIWTIGTEAAAPTALRLQVGAVHMAFYPSEVGRFDVQRLPVPVLATGLQLGQVVELVGLRIAGDTVGAGQDLDVVLYWRALAPMDTSYTVFLQAVDEDGAKAGQIDRLPCGGGCLTTAWRPGDIAGEHYDLLIAPDAAAGSYEIIAGMYDLATGEQLPFFDTQGREAGTYLSLETIHVQP